MNRKWAIVRFATQEAASSAHTGSLSLRGPPGVSMELSMQPLRDVTSGGRGLQDEGGFVVGEGGSDRWGKGTRRQEDVPTQWELVVEAAFIQCRSMLAYANVSAAGGPCQVIFWFCFVFCALHVVDEFVVGGLLGLEWVATMFCGVYAESVCYCSDPSAGPIASRSTNCM